MRKQPTKKHKAAAPPPAQTFAPKSVVGPQLGISGTTNSYGRLLTEYLDKLSHTKAFGVAGSVAWGEWERLSKTDPHIAMALTFVCDPVREAKWDVEPADDSEEAEKHAEFIEWNFCEMLEPGLDEIKETAAKGALGAGFSLFEKVIEYVPCDYLGHNAYVLTKLSECLPSSVIQNGWQEGPSFDLEKIRQRGTQNDGKGTWVNVELEADKVLLFSWERRGKNYQGVSAFRPVYYFAKIREMLAKLIGISLQREGAGIPVATTTDAANKLTPESLEALETFMANLVMHENANAVMPPGWMLEWIYSPGANKGHVVDTWNALGLCILQLLGAQQMVLGTGATGSRAVGEVHHAASAAYVRKVVAFLADVFNGVGRRKYTGVIRQLIDLNFGAQKRYPKIVLTPSEGQLDPLSLATASKTATEAGLLTVTIDDENFMRRRMGYSPIDEATRDGVAQKKLDSARAMMATKPESDEETEKEQEIEPKPTPPTPLRARASASRVLGGPFVPYRSLRASEKPLDPQRIKDFLDNAQAAFEREAKPEVLAMLVRSEEEIRKAMATRVPAAVGSVPLNTTGLAKVVAQFLARSREEGQRQVRGELKRMRAGEKLEAAAGEEDPEASSDPDIVSETDEVVSAQRDALVRRMESRLRSDLENQAVEALRTASEDADELVARTVTNLLNGSAFRSDAAQVVTKAWNLGRDEAIRMLGATQVEYSCLMDGGSCTPCEDMDGTTADVDSPEHDAMLPPNRDCEGGGRCRCMLVIVPGSAPDEGDE